MKQIIKSNYKKEWVNAWAMETPPSLYRFYIYIENEVPGPALIKICTSVIMSVVFYHNITIINGLSLALPAAV